MAPVDLIINDIDTRVKAAQKERDTEEMYCPAWHENNGRMLGLTELREYLTALKSLFSDNSY